MKRLIAFLLVFGMVAAPAWGHDKRSVDYDKKDSSADLDIKRVRFWHDDDFMWGDIKTDHGFTNSFMRRKGWFAFHVKKAGKKAYFRLALWRHPWQDKWTTRVYYFTSDNDPRGDLVGYGRAGRDDSNQVWFSLKRSVVGMGGDTHLRWRALSAWCADSDCDDLDFDRAPNWDPKKHFMGG